MQRAPSSLLAATFVLLFARSVHADEHDNCVAVAKTQAEIDACPPPDKPIEVMVRSRPPARSASDWDVDRGTVSAAPHTTGADVLDVAPGVFVSDKGLPGRAPHLSLRGFDGTSGQDVEIYLGNIPINQISHLRSPGYADMRLVMPEIIRSVQIAHGPFDPKQGDFAVAGSVKLNLGLEKPGFWAKGGAGSFGSRRLFLAFAPDDDDFSETFAAFATDSVDGPGGTRGGERSSFVGQLGGGQTDVLYHATVAIGSARFDFPGLLRRDFVQHGGDPYSSPGPLGRDRTSQALIGSDVLWRVGEGTLGVGAFAGKTKTTFHQNVTGYVLDPLAGLPPVNSDDSEQVDDAATLGLTLLYRHGVELTSPRDAIELGMSARVDSTEQTDTRLFPDGTINERPLDQTVDVTTVGAYADVALYPIKRVVVRGGPRLDSLSYALDDHAHDAGLERTAQGFHLGNKGLIDVAVGGGAHVVASYGEGFRSPSASELQEGDRVPFTKVRATELGIRVKEIDSYQASLTGFLSWLDNDRVLDVASRKTLLAPASSRRGAALAVAVKTGIFGAALSATYVQAKFTEGDASYREGDRVPYAPAFVLRDDASVRGTLHRIDDRPLRGMLGLGVGAAVDRALPGGGSGGDALSVDGQASLSYRGVELALHGTNLLDQTSYDSQYVYVSNFERSAVLPEAAPHVLVSAPFSVFLTLQIYIRGKKDDYQITQEGYCLEQARTDDERDACRE